MTTLVIPSNTIGLVPGKNKEQTISPTEVRVITVESTESLPPVVTYSPDGSFFLNLASMQVGRFYPVTFEGKELVAVREEDDSVAFYSKP